MAVAPHETIPYWGFHAGESGQGAPWVVGWRLLRQRLIYAGTFQARNMLRSLGHTLMPRSGLVEVTPNAGMVSGKVLGFTYVPVPGKTGLVIIGSSVYQFDLETFNSTLVRLGGLNTTPQIAVQFAVDAAGKAYFTIPNDQTYVVDPVAGTVNTLPGSPGGNTICIHNESLGSRLVVGNIPTQGGDGGVTGANLVYASTLNNFSNWKLAGQAGADPNFPANAITVGDAWAVTALFSQRTHLVVAKQESWWVITGAINNFTARPILRNTNRWVQQSFSAGMDDDNNIWFVPFFDDIPMVFDGAKLGEQRTLHFNGFAYTQPSTPPVFSPPFFSVHRNLRHNEIFMAAVTTLGANAVMNVALRQEDMWTFHTFKAPSGWNGCWTAAGSGGRVHMCDGGAVGVNFRAYTWVSHLDTRVPQPANGLENDVDVATALAANVTFPEYWDRTGMMLAVRAVIVDIKRWNTGSSNHNHYDLSVLNLRQYTDINATPYSQPAAKTGTFDEATNAVPGGVGASQTVRITHGLDVEHGNGFQVSFTNIVGLEIQKVQVLLEVLAQEPIGV